MKQETVIARLVRSEFPDQAVSVKAEPFTYLHHDREYFGDRTIPSFRVNLTAKTSTRTYTNRVQANDADVWQVVSFLRRNGYFATYNGEIVIADVTEDRLPVNNAFKFEWK